MTITPTCLAWTNHVTIQDEFAQKKRVVKRFNVVELRQKSTTVLKKVRKLIQVHHPQHNKNAKAPKTSPQKSKTELKNSNILQRSKRKLVLEKEKKQVKKKRTRRALQTQPLVTEYNVFKHEKIVYDAHAHNVVDSGIVARSIGLSSTKVPAPTPTSTKSPSLVSTPAPTPTSTKSPSSSNAPSSIENKSSKIPTISTKAPSASTKMPSKSPTNIPSNSPIVVASTMPSLEDSSTPSSRPSFKPSIIPTIAKSSKPSHTPSVQVVVSTKQPSRAPVTSSNAPSTTMNRSTKQPTRAPIIVVSSMPSIVDISVVPSRQVISTKQPTQSPVGIASPYTNPSSRPSLLPSQDNSLSPSIEKSNSPTMTSAIPSVLDSNRPSFQPSSKHSTSPSHAPIIQPSDRPSANPTFQPSDRSRVTVTFAPTPNDNIQSVRGISNASKVYISVTTALAAGMVAGISSTNAQLSCGSVGGAFTTANGDVTALSLTKSASDTLCMLFRVSVAPSSSATLETLSPTSTLADYYLTPVARSYQGNDWQRVGGKYAQHLEITCAASDCDLTMPALPLLPEGKFVLMPFLHSISDRAEVSRFYQQTTFGPTMAMINGWDYSSPMENEMAAWVKNQMNEATTPITSHRAFFRERINGELEYWEEGVNLDQWRKQMFKTRNFCDAGARWTKYAFSTDDYGQYITATSQGDGTYLITDELGFPRTVNAWIREDTETPIGEGSFQVNWHVSENLGGRVSLFDPSTNSYFNLQGGNPPVVLPLTAANTTFVDLPAESEFITTPIITSRNYWDVKYDETLYLNYDLTDPFCATYDPFNTRSVVGTLAGSSTQVRFARYIEFRDNTIETPLESGGSDIETCSNPLMDFKNAETCKISSSPNACMTNYYEEFPAGSAVLVCGSDSEVGNNPTGQSIFHAAWTTDLKGGDNTGDQKKNVFAMIAIDSDNTLDQLRQRVAWALSQIVVVTPNQITNPEFSEIFLNYYDIFVKNAFGNYFDILKEVSYSPMMGEMLGFVDSKSKPYILSSTGVIAFPDENYAREVMQLFSIGVHLLNMDGTKILDNNGQPILTYTDTDIQNYSRAWTGFEHSHRRSNQEAYYWDIGNRMDPMIINGVWRDFFPKTDLSGGYIGDRYPLCTDLPARHFLHKGATFRLVGSSKKPLLRTQPDWWFSNNYSIRMLELDSNSELLNVLCNDNGNGCEFPAVVTLDTNLNCVGVECEVDDMRLIKVASNPDVHYEYVRLPCVEQTFYENSLTVQNAWPRISMCANGDLSVAQEACCEWPTWTDPAAVTDCRYTAEKTKFATSEQRCAARFPGQGDQCMWTWYHTNFTFDGGLTYQNGECHRGYDDNYFWTSADECILEAKVSRTGKVAQVHNPNWSTSPNTAYLNTDVNMGVENTNYFSVAWETDFPIQSAGSCGTPSCQPHGNECLCTVTISNSAVFSSLPSLVQVESDLKIGSFDPVALGGYSFLASSGGVEAYQKDSNSGYNQDTIFKITYFGETLFLKNQKSLVNIDGLSFRNPVQFLNPALREARDAAYETDAVLKSYLHHPNTPPFLAMRMIQRFGVSNPSPSYIQAVAEAFKNGVYTSGNQSFGTNGDYGSMEAMVAAIILHDEARNPILDSDPSAGSLREPLLKLLGYMKSMEFDTSANAPELRLNNLQQRIGQQAHSIPNVFSFFLPEYGPPGHIEAGGLVAPESQVMNGPTLTSMTNGNFALTDWGLQDCYGGYGDKTLWYTICWHLTNGWQSIQDNQRGKLHYTPQDTSSTSAIVNDLALLLTGDRLNASARLVLENAYATLGGLPAVQKLITTTPEFHGTGVVNAQSTNRPDGTPPSPSNEEYKAIVFLNLSGGADSMNFLVPHSVCTGKDLYAEYASVRTELALDSTTLLQIDVADQLCAKFGLHPNLSALQTLYNDKHLSFVANVGVLQEYVTQENWRQKTDDTTLFAHNSQQSEIQRCDIFEEIAGRGVGGRMLDVLAKNGFKVNALSTKGATEALAAADAPLIVVPSADLYEKFDSSSSDVYNQNPVDPNRFISQVKELNKANNLGSSLFSETYSNVLQQGLDENQLLYDALQTTSLNTAFPDTNLGRQLKTVATMMKTKDTRGVDRDVFYVEQTGYDTHTNLNTNFDGLTERLDAAVDAFVTEMKDQNKWGSVTVVAVSEFARTLTTNSGSGSDHAWGGNAMVMSGAFDPTAGGRIHGEYPTDVSLQSPLNINERGVLIPTTPFDSIWNGVAQWFGVTDTNDLNTVLPNRNNFGNTLMTSDDLYGITTTASPTTSPAPSIGGTDAPTKSLVPSISPSIDTTNAVDFDWYINDFGTIDVILGTTIRFIWGGNHDVHYSVDGTCTNTASNNLYFKGDVSGEPVETFNTLGQFTYICLTHCGTGQRVTFNVVEAMSPSSSPSFASASPSKKSSDQPSAKPSPSPSSSPTKSPSVSPSASPTTTKVPTSSPTIANTPAPTAFDQCSIHTKGGTCKKATGCSWNGTTCVSTGSPVAAPVAEPTTPTAPTSPVAAPVAEPTGGSCDAAGVSCAPGTNANCCNGCSGGKPDNRVCE